MARRKSPESKNFETYPSSKLWRPLNSQKFKTTRTEDGGPQRPVFLRTSNLKTSHTRLSRSQTKSPGSRTGMVLQETTSKEDRELHTVVEQVLVTEGEMAPRHLEVVLQMHSPIFVSTTKRASLLSTTERLRRGEEALVSIADEEGEVLPLRRIGVINVEVVAAEATLVLAEVDNVVEVEDGAMEVVEDTEIGTK